MINLKKEELKTLKKMNAKVFIEKYGFSFSEMEGGKICEYDLYIHDGMGYYVEIVGNSIVRDETIWLHNEIGCQIPDWVVYSATKGLFKEEEEKSFCK